MNETNNNPIEDIVFTYEFNETIERVFDCFRNVNILLECTFSKHLSNLQTEKHLNNLDIVGIISNFEWNKKFSLVFKKEKVTKSNDFCELFYKCINVNGLENAFDLSFQFYRNSCEKNTLFISTFFPKYNLISDMIKKECSIKDLEEMCKRIEDLLKSKLKTIIQNESILIERPVKEIVYFLMNSKLSLPLYLKLEDDDLLNIVQPISLGTYIYLYENKEKKNILYEYKITGLLKSDSTYIINIVKRKADVEISKIKLSVIYLSDLTSAFFVKHEFSKYIGFNEVSGISKRKTTFLKNIKTTLENKNYIKEALWNKLSNQYI
jgi:hypothetical protein